MTRPPSSRVISTNGFRQLAVEGRPFPVVGGTVRDSTASDPRRLESDVWPKAAALGLNTVFVPVSWQSIEPKEGVFDFSPVDALLDGARRHGLKLALLWFGAWKRGTSCFAPDWVKLDWDRFPLARPLLGRRTEILSPCADETLQAETAAFAALLRRVREVETAAGGEPTVVLVQIEEGIGMVGGSRDTSGSSDQRWAEGVPEPLLRGLAERGRSLHPEIAKALGRRGSWTDVFGPNADGAFMAWQFARHVETLARTGAAEWPVPMFVDDWAAARTLLRSGERPGGAPSGEMADIWDIGAPSVFRTLPSSSERDLRFLHPSVGERAVPSVLPRAAASSGLAAKELFFFGQILASGVSFAGLDTVPPPAESETSRLLARTNAALRALSGKIGSLRSEATSRGFFQLSDGPETVTLGDFSLLLEWTRPLRDASSPGGLLLMLDADGTFWAVGTGVRLDPRHDRAGWSTGILFQREGLFDDGSWTDGRLLNGDERDLDFPDDDIAARHFALYRRPL